MSILNVGIGGDLPINHIDLNINLNLSGSSFANFATPRSRPTAPRFSGPNLAGPRFSGPSLLGWVFVPRGGQGGGGIPHNASADLLDFDSGSRSGAWGFTPLLSYGGFSGGLDNLQAFRGPYFNFTGSGDDWSYGALPSSGGLSAYRGGGSLSDWGGLGGWGGGLSNWSGGFGGLGNFGFGGW